MAEAIRAGAAEQLRMPLIVRVAEHHIDYWRERYPDALEIKFIEATQTCRIRLPSAVAYLEISGVV